MVFSKLRLSACMCMRVVAEVQLGPQARAPHALWHADAGWQGTPAPPSPSTAASRPMHTAGCSPVHASAAGSIARQRPHHLPVSTPALQHNTAWGTGGSKGAFRHECMHTSCRPAERLLRKDKDSKLGVTSYIEAVRNDRRIKCCSCRRACMLRLQQQQNMDFTCLQGR